MGQLESERSKQLQVSLYLNFCLPISIYLSLSFFLSISLVTDGFSSILFVLFSFSITFFIGQYLYFRRTLKLSLSLSISLNLFLSRNKSNKVDLKMIAPRLFSKVSSKRLSGDSRKLAFSWLCYVFAARSRSVDIFLH